MAADCGNILDSSAVNQFASGFAADLFIRNALKKLTRNAVHGVEYTFAELSPVTSLGGLEQTSSGMWIFSKRDRHDFTSNEVWSLAKRIFYGEIHGKAIMEVREKNYKMAVNAATIETAFGHVEDRIHRQATMPRGHPAASWMVCHWLLIDYLKHDAEEDLGLSRDGGDAAKRLQDFTRAVEQDSNPNKLPSYFTIL